MTVLTRRALNRATLVFARLRPGLMVLRDEAGRDLYDLPDAPRPDEDAPAPVRFLYDYDNLLLSHHDRTRVVTQNYRDQQFAPDGPMPSIVLVDGFTAGVWRLTTTKDTARLTVRPFARWSAKDTAAAGAEGDRLLSFLAPTAASRTVELVRSGD